MAAMTRLSGRALATLLPDLTHTPGPRYAALARAVASLLLDGRVAPGTTLPSERELAGVLSLSRATVTAAYDALRAERALISRTGSGSVTALPPTGRLAAGAARSPGWPAGRLAGPPGSASDPSAGPGRRTSTSGPIGHPSAEDVIDLSCAVFPAPEQLLPAVARAAAELADYTHTSGYEPAGIPDLRQAIADRFTARGVPTHAAQILVTNGALHGIDLILRLLIGPGDRVLTELPTYSGLLDAVRASGARTLAVPVSPQGGWQLAPMISALRQSSPRLAVLVPDFHNPTGFLAPDADRVDILRAARRSGTTVLVDESFVDIGFVPAATPAAALDPSVLTVGSLSKPVWGGLRVGWIRASSEMIQRLVRVRAAMDMGQSILEQLVAVELFPDLPMIIEERLRQVRPQCDALIASIAEHLPRWRTSMPAGGLCLWVELDAPLATPLTMRAGQYGVRIVAGSRFGVDGTMERFLRLPYALGVPTLATAVERLAAAWRDIDQSTEAYSPLVVA